MVEAKAQAAQLDSVTDVVHEQEVDATRALQAMNAFLSDSSGTSSNNTSTAGTSNAATTSLDNDLEQKLTITANITASVIRSEDVQLICSELDVTEEVATQALRDAANESGDAAVTDEKDALVILALRKLVSF
jgi:HYPK UBA domain